LKETQQLFICVKRQCPMVLIEMFTEP